MNQDAVEAVLPHRLGTELGWCYDAVIDMVSAGEGLSLLRSLYPYPEAPPGVPRNVHGWNTWQNYATFRHLIRRDMSVIVEVGAWVGQSTLAFCDLAPGAVIIAVDHWRGSAEHHANPK